MPISRGAFIAAVALASLNVGCGAEPEATEVQQFEQPAVESTEVDDPDALYGPDGIPLESDEHIAGLTLPRGLERLDLEQPRLHVFGSEIGLDPLIRYFGPRLVTGQITREQAETTYHEAVPRGVRGGEVKLDVSLRTSSRYPTLVEVREHVPPSQERVTAEEIRSALEQNARHRE